MPTIDHDDPRADAQGTESPVDVARRLAEAAPSAAVVAELVALQRQPLDTEAALFATTAWERARAWMDAHQQATVAAVDGPVPADPEQAEFEAGVTAALLSPPLRLSPGQASRRVRMARALTDRFTATATAMREGWLPLRYAEALVDATGRLCDELARKVEALVLPGARRQTLGQFRSAVDRAVIQVAPEESDRARRRTRADRRVEVDPPENGMAWLHLFAPVEDVHAIWTAATAAADAARRGGATDGLDALRADAIASWAWAALNDPDAPRRHGRAPNVTVVVDLPTLLGLADNPAELVGVGPVPPSVARELAADGTWRRFLTDETGRLIDLGRVRYRPNQALRDHLLASHQTCAFPGCPMPPWRGDLDHREGFGAGGRTDRMNLGPLCRFHHNLKTHHGWRLDVEPDGAVTWTSPLGHRYRYPPPRPGPVVPPDE